MKKNIFKTLAAAVCFAALVLTGCVNNFEGTTRNYKQKAEQQTGNYGENNSAKGAHTYSFGFSPETITTASKNTEITVNFSSQFELDLDSAESAFTFYKLKKNTKNEKYYPEHDGVITKTLLHVTEPDSYSDTVSFLYRLDTEEVTTDKIAFVVDGTKLKYKNGLAAMSNDGNLKAGEETDSIVRYISVTSKKDGTSTETIGNSYSESWTANNYNISYLYSYGELQTSESDTTPSGKYRLYCYAPSKTLDADGLTSTYDDSLAAVLGKKFKLQIQKPGSTKWEDGAALTFAYHSSYQFKNYDYYSSNTYTADVDTKAFAQGTKWRIVRDKSVVVGKPSDWVKDAYGHAPFEYYPKVIEKAYPSYPSEYEEIPYGDENTTYIFAWADGDLDPKPTFNKANCDYMTAFFTQTDFVNWIETNENSIEVNIKTWMVELDKTDGFILVDSKNTIVPSTTTVHKNGEGKIDKVIITPKNEKLNLWWDSYDVYVGSGTTIKENKNYPKQVQFGCYPDLSKGDLSGYVLLAQNVVKTGSDYTTAEDWAQGQYESIWINENSYGRSDNYGNWNNHFDNVQKVYLIAGETYKIQFVNGYNSNTNTALFLENHEWATLCYYGHLYIVDADEDVWYTQNYEKHLYNYNENATYECTKTGYYYICANRPESASVQIYSNSRYNARYGENAIIPEGMDYATFTRDWYYDAYRNWDGSDILGRVDTFDNPYYVESDPDPYPATVTATGPALFEFTPDWDLDAADGTYNGTVIGNTHITDDAGNWVMNGSKHIPYHWGNIYYHIYME